MKPRARQRRAERAAILLFVAHLTAWGSQPPAESAEPAGPMHGATETGSGLRIEWSYHFDHNALSDARLLGDSLAALTASGNLVSFDLSSLAIKKRRIVPGRGTAICAGAEGALLVGTEEGQIYEVEPTTLALHLQTNAGGRVAWLASGKAPGFGDRATVAVVDGRADVWPHPGEPWIAYEARSRDAALKKSKGLWALINGNGQERRIPFSQTSFAVPSSFLLDGGRLWMGTDKGEWGGEYSILDLRSGRIRRFEIGLGVLGFALAPDGAVIAYGGISHMGVQTPFLAEIDRQDPGRRLTPQKRVPGGPLDLIAPDRRGKGFWVLSEHSVYHSDRNFSDWSKRVDLGGRWFGGRSYSVGSTPTIRTLVASGPDETRLIAVTGRDGVIEVVGTEVRPVNAPGQLEDSVIEIWPTSLGTVFLAPDDSHRAWRLAADRWERLRFFPAQEPSSGYGWRFAEPIAEDAGGILVYFGSGVVPGDRGLLRSLGKDAEVVAQWSDRSSYSGDPILRTAEGVLIEVRDGELLRWSGKAWEHAGTRKGPTNERKRRLRGRSYIPLGTAVGGECFLDTELGDILRLTRSREGYELGPWLSPRGPAPAGVFDAVNDGEGYILAATAKGLVRFNPATGARRAIRTPDASQEFTTIARDAAGRLWTAGDLLYVSSDEGGAWTAVRLPMLSRTYAKRVRRSPESPAGMILGLYDRGVVKLTVTQAAAAIRPNMPPETRERTKSRR